MTESKAELGKSNLRTRAFAAVRWTAASNVSRAVLMLLQMAALARIMSPAELGRAALILSLIALATNISDVGFSNILIRFQDADHEEKSTLYWLNVAIGATLAAIGMLCSQSVANFYQIPQLGGAIALGCSVFFISSITLQMRVLAERDLEFSTVSKIEVIGTLAGAVVAVSTAILGYGSSSLIYGQLASVSIGSILIWFLLSSRWKPSLVFKFFKIRRFLTHGSHMFLINIGVAVTMQADVIISGIHFSPTIMGFYTQPRELCMKAMLTINPIITRISLPLISQFQNEAAAAGRIYVRIVKMSSTIMFPVYGFIFLLSDQLVELLLGEQWSQAAPILKLLCIWFSVRSVNNPMGSFLYAMGKTKIALWYQGLILTSVVTVAYFGSMYGDEISLVVAMAAANLAIAALAWAFVLRPEAQISAIDFFGAIARPAVCTIFAVLVSSYLFPLVEVEYLQILVGGCTGAAAYVGLSFLINRECLHDILEATKLRRAKT